MGLVTQTYNAIKKETTKTGRLLKWVEGIGCEHLSPFCRLLKD